VSFVMDHRFRRHAIAAMACLLLSTAAQLAGIGWLCLVAPRASYQCRRGGILPQTEAAAGRPLWWIAGLKVTGPALTTDSPPSIDLQPTVGRWGVYRQALAQPVPVDPVPPVLLSRDAVPWWTDGGFLDAPSQEDVDRFTQRYDLAFGWPFPALGCKLDVRFQPVERRLFDCIVLFPFDPNTTATSDPLGILGIFPTRVIWLGVAANIGIGTMAFAFPLLLIAAVRAVRGSRRVRRGLCVHCGYGPWSGVANCPECGAARAAVQPGRE